MNEKLNPLNWLTLRAKEPEFAQFLEEENAAVQTLVEKATARCADDSGNFSQQAFETFKESYLSFCRKSWGLPANKGVFF